MGNKSLTNHEKHYKKNKRKILIIGVENAGKTNLCRILSNGTFIYDHIPTEELKSYEINYNGQEWEIIVISISSEGLRWKRTCPNAMENTYSWMPRNHLRRRYL